MKKSELKSIIKEVMISESTKPNLQAAIKEVSNIRDELDNILDKTQSILNNNNHPAGAYLNSDHALSLKRNDLVIKSIREATSDVSDFVGILYNIKK